MPAKMHPIHLLKMKQDPKIHERYRLINKQYSYLITSFSFFKQTQSFSKLFLLKVIYSNCKPSLNCKVHNNTHINTRQIMLMCKFLNLCLYIRILLVTENINYSPIPSFKYVSWYVYATPTLITKVLLLVTRVQPLKPSSGVDMHTDRHNDRHTHTHTHTHTQQLRGRKQQAHANQLSYQRINLKNKLIYSNI